jgi:hypothetical protein
MKPFDRASEALHRLTMGESVLGEGRADEFLSTTFQVPESGYDYVLVTASRILVAKDVQREDRSWDFELSWAQVREFAERDLGHQWLLLLRHDPIVKTRHRPKYRFLWMRWGNAEVAAPETETCLRFSRRETAAAEAVRVQLAAQNVPQTEHAEDLAAFAKRAREPNLAFEAVLEDLKRRGKL